MSAYISDTLIEEAARIAHEVNRAYCASIGDASQVPWSEAEDWQRKSAINGATAIAEGKIKTPGDSHRSWLVEKESDGWIWGPVKDPTRKEHPCMVPFEELPGDQQIKDHLFIGTVLAVFSREGSP